MPPPHTSLPLITDIEYHSEPYRFPANDNSSETSEPNLSRRDSEFDLDTLKHVVLPPPEDEGNQLDDNDNDSDDDDQRETTGVRKAWLCSTWILTWWIPGPLLRRCGVNPRPDIQTAWREKLALCIIIFFLCALIIFFIAFSGPLICPRQHVFSAAELQSNGANGNPWIAIRGEVFHLNDWNHPKGVTSTELWSKTGYGGKDVGVDGDVNSLFPISVSDMCDGPGGPGSIDPSLVQMAANRTYDKNSRFHDFRFYTGDYRPYWYWQQMQFLRNHYFQGHIGIDPDSVHSIRDTTGKLISIIDDSIYDITPYVVNGRKFIAPSGYTPKGSLDFFPDLLIELFTNGGPDITKLFHSHFSNASEKKRLLTCMRNIYFAGKVDNRRSFPCMFSDYVLLVSSILLVSIIGFKFLAALQLGPTREPEEHDRFVIIQIPCYTEDEESLRKTIDSVAVLRYDDKRKLLFLIADGLIVGSGNDLTTPRIVLDILGGDPDFDPQPLIFHSIGEGNKQLNMGKVYSGLYECNGHIVPYVVVVKVGKPSEKNRPGNRGKRDSQMILMKFLNNVHFGTPMTPMELELHHQFKNVIGVDPSYYEYILMVDADTEVMPDSLNRMVSCMVHDARIMGICGETAISNEKESWVTMIQVYEYYISHHLAKAFESLFGSVTCLPGCFCMYRIRSPGRRKPLLVANNIIHDYSESHVDTLHKKNLLSLGEDRYLTTLMMKHFPKMKMSFTSDAKCFTTAPDRWPTLLSQRRRWINSTVHNLLELVWLPQMCGFCCFSMRFVVFVDLFATVIMPATIAYLAYLLYSVAFAESNFPFISLVLLCAVYGFQVILFVLKRQWQHVMWMIIYILAIPVFSFFIPVYAFWHFDDFSWGNTRVVVGEKGKKKQIPADEEPFDPKSIPRQRWVDYEKEMWEGGSNATRDTYRTHPSAATPESHRGRSPSFLGSVYASDKSFRGSEGDRNRSTSPALSSGGQHMQARERRGSSASLSGSEWNGRHRERSASHSSLAGFDNSGAVPIQGGGVGYYSQEMLPRSGTASRHSVHIHRNRSEYDLSLVTPLPSPKPVRPASTLGAVSMYSEQPGLMASPSLGRGSPSPSLWPTEEEILSEVKRILATADLVTVTKKQVREELSLRFGVDMMGRKQVVNRCIERVLQP